MNKEDEFYKSFKEKLKTSHEFPGDYTFKFILKSDHKKIAELQRIFDKSRPQISSKSSKKNNYASITIKVYVVDADEVIFYYKEAQKIPNIISL